MRYREDGQALIAVRSDGEESIVRLAAHHGHSHSDWVGQTIDFRRKDGEKATTRLAALMKRKLSGLKLLL